jgi:hypothetical protein
VSFGNGLGVRVGLEGRGEGEQEFGVFGGGADGDADGFGKTHPAHRTNNDAFKEKFVAKGFGDWADRNEEKIGFAGNGSDAEFVEFVEEAAAFDAIRFDRTANMIGVIEGGESGSLADTGNVERCAELVHFGYECRMADAIADAKTRKAVNLRKSAKGKDVVVFAEERFGIGKIRPGSILTIGFVEDDKNIARDFSEESREFRGAKGGAGGIVGIGDVNDAGLRSDGGGDGVEVKSVIAHRRQDEAAAAGANGDREKSEGTFAGDAVKTGAKKNAGGKVNDFAGAEADEDLFRADLMAGGKDFAETLASSVRIPVGFTEGAAGGFHRFWGGAEGVLVGGEFDGVDFEILLDFLDGPARNIGGKALNIIGDQLFESMGHENSL